MHTVKMSSTGSGTKFAAAKLSKGIYVFDSIAVTMNVGYALRGSVKIKYEIGAEEYQYTSLGGGYLAKGIPLQIICPKEIKISDEAWIYSSVYHQEADQQHQLELNYRRIPYDSI